MKAFKLWLLAIFLVTVVNIVNRTLFKRSIKHLSKKERNEKMAGYDRREAMALDAFAGRDYATFWNAYLKTENGYKFGVLDEMISSAAGKNEADGTLSDKGTGKLSRFFFGKRLVNILNKLDADHCKNAIDLTKGTWVNTRKNEGLLKYL
ncbi:hypothetical protein [Chryseobacterium sp. MP_3.2]|uniref:hypothetical protein n=1 Tax=Chryseobacterium sp. MP_3.2 TaxID=3071712 RepID=UPI002E0B2B85|nr:hypothetical protein [Chryseobacterium sp. MP_3.2]